MKSVIIIGSGIAGMNCAIKCASLGIHAELVSPFPSERAQSVMAAGGINAVTAGCDNGDSVECHIEDTLRGGAGIAGRNAVSGLCGNAEGIIRYLEGIGTVFTTDDKGRPAKRAFGGQSFRRTHYCGSATGKQIVSALVMEVRRYEAQGLITRRLRACFHSALISDGICYGAILFDEVHYELTACYADALIIATGGQNALFGKTTGSLSCDGYVAGKLLTQGVELKNLEFIQYHPTTLETPQKKILISEAVRGEGGRLFYEEDGKRVYFMEDKYGPKGNLMTRDVVSREMASLNKDFYLDISFAGKELIDERLSEVRDLCSKYGGIDITKEPVPVTCSIHFFMGGIAVHKDHQTNIKNLYAIGECASIYHGANRLGGNSLLAAIYGGDVVSEAVAGKAREGEQKLFDKELEDAGDSLKRSLDNKSSFPVMYVRDMIASTMNEHLGIVRDAKSLEAGIRDLDYYLDISDKIRYDNSVLPYFNYSLTGIAALARAVMTSALFRQESRGAHFRSDHPEEDPDSAYASIVSYVNGEYRIRYDKEDPYED